MKRVRTWLFDGAAGASLVLCTVAIGLWVRSEFVHDSYGYTINLAGSPPTMWVQYRTGLSTWQGEVWFVREAVGNNFDLEVYRKYWASRGLHFDPVGVGRWAYGDLIGGGQNVPADTFIEWLGFRAAHRQTPNNNGQWYRVQRYAVPFWAIVTMFAILPVQRFAIALRRALIRLLWRSVRIEPGHCRHCGYDLRATPDRCPECGTVPSKFPDDRRLPIYWSCNSVPELAWLPRARCKEIWRECRSRNSPEFWFWLAVALGWAAPFAIVDQPIFDLAYWIPAIAFPYWGIAVVVARHIRFAESLPEIRKRVDSVCPHCGRELRGTPDRCPERWTVPPKKDAGSGGPAT